MAAAIKEGRAEWEKNKAVTEKKSEKPAAKKETPKAAEIADQSV